MKAADVPLTSVVEGPGLPSAAPPPTDAVAPAAAPARPAASRTTRQLLAIAFAVAWLACPLIEPMPAGHEQPYPLWQLPIDVAALATIVLAVGALWRGSRRAPRLAIAAGLMMAVETIVCPYAGHTPIGWWTWVQVGLSLFVLFAGAALQARRRA